MAAIQLPCPTGFEAVAVTDVHCFLQRFIIGTGRGPSDLNCHNLQTTKTWDVDTRRWRHVALLLRMYLHFGERKRLPLKVDVREDERHVHPLHRIARERFHPVATAREIDGGATLLHEGCKEETSRAFRCTPSLPAFRPTCRPGCAPRRASAVRDTQTVSIPACCAQACGSFAVKQLCMV